MNDIDRAVSILRAGGVIAFPTETVYGLGADARNAAAVQRVFDIKGRPSTNPVIVHVADATVGRRFASEWPDAATALVERFWPGPLTLVLPKVDAIVPAVTAGRSTVGLRAPDHPRTLELLRQFNGPLIGPSANRSTHVSPTTAQHVRDELGDALDLVIDGGPCRVGIESTVLDLSGASPAILRPGAISREQIQAIIGEVAMRPIVADASTAASAPGQQAVHYAPITPTYRFDPGDHLIEQWIGVHPEKPAIALIIAAQPRTSANIKCIAMPDRPEDYARQMYAALRHADRQSLAAIWIEMPPAEPEWLAVRDRLLRASRTPPGS